MMQEKQGVFIWAYHEHALCHALLFEPGLMSRISRCLIQSLPKFFFL